MDIDLVQILKHTTAVLEHYTTASLVDCSYKDVFYFGVLK